MTMTTQFELHPAKCLQSPVARLFQRLANWQESRHHRKMAILSMAEIPERLRQDIGLDGGAPLRPERGAGRSFDHTRHPDTQQRQWGW